MARWLLLLTALLGAALLRAAPDETVGETGKAHLLEVKGAIGPATADYLKRGIKDAATANAKLVILRIDTPGGLDSSMRDIIRDILASPVPVAAWVAPNGARAASAGTYIMYAAHVAAMAPATNLGSATPVSIGGIPSPPTLPKPTEKPDAAKDAGQNEKEEPAKPEGAMERKVINDAVAYIRGLARLRGRNIEWAEQAVRKAANLSAVEALEQGVIDFIAADLPELLGKADGREVSIGTGKLKLATKSLAIIEIEADWRTEFLAVITNPNVAYILMLLGVYGLFFELANPGVVLPGVIGGICLLLALYAFQVLPVNYAGLALILLGIIFMVSEMFLPSFGALGIGGVIAFVAGSIILMDTTVPGFGISLPLIFSVALTTAAFFMVVVGMALKARTRPVVSGAEEMVGSAGESNGAFEIHGSVHVRGEIWQAQTKVALVDGQPVRVIAMDGLVLHVEPLGQIDNTHPPEET